MPMVQPGSSNVVSRIDGRAGRSVAEPAGSLLPIVSVRAPEYLPRLEYVAQMQASDHVIVAASRQYVRQSWQNRTRIRTPGGAQWLSVPVRRGQHGRSSAATITAGVPDWRRHHWKAIVSSYGHAPYFAHYSDRIRDFLWMPGQLLGNITATSVRLLHSLYGLACTLSIDRTASKLVPRSGGCRMLAALEDRPDRDPALRLHFTEHPYRQAFAGFEPGMTALDLLFGYGPAAPARLQSMATVKQTQIREN